MKKLLHTRTILVLGLLVFGFSFGVSALNIPKASAVTAAQYCGTPGPKKSADSVRSCRTGFDAGKNGSPGIACRGALDNDACVSGYEAGKAERNNGGGGGGSSGGGSSGGGGGDDSASTTTDDGPSGEGSGAEPVEPPGPEHINCDDAGVNCTDPAAAESCNNDGCDLIGRYVNPAITVLSAMVVVAAIASIIYGGIQYTMSSGDPQKVSEAKDRITKTLIAFIMYLFLFSFLQFIIPGGFLNRGG